MAVISSPLAKSLQGGLVQRVAGSTFGGGRGIGPVSSQDLGGGRSEELLESNQSTLSTISSNLDSIASELRTVRSGIDSIATRIASESKLEEAAAKADAEYNRRLAERQIRTQGEQQLENKIQSALTAPVTAVATKVSGVFFNVGRAIQQLLFGWITIQIVDLIEAFSTGNTKKLQDIAGNILKTLAIVVAANGVLSLIKIGIGKVVSLVLGLAAKVSGFVIKGLFLKPFEILVNAIKNSWKRVVGAGAAATNIRTPSPPDGKPPGQKGGKFGFMNVVGGLITGVSGIMNFLNGENIDAALAALSFLPGKGFVFQGIRTAAATAFTLDEISEAFGGNLTGAKKKELEEQQKKAEGNQKPATAAQTTPVAQPQTPMMGDNKGNKEQEPKEDAVPVKGPQQSGESGVSVAPGTAGTAGAAASSQPAVAPQTPMTPSAGDLSLGSTAATSNVTPAGGTATSAATTAPEQTPANITPIQTQSANTKMESLGPEPKPQTTVIAQTPAPTSTQTPSMGPGASTDVPKIKSSNPENFYALYSQFNYNVVI